MKNLVILIGNLGADPEGRSTQGGSTVANLRIATSERRKDKDGNWQDHTEWHRVVAFGKTAENAIKFLSKGRQVYVEGRLQTSSYEKDGQKRYSTEIIANDIRFLGGKGEGNNAPGNEPEPAGDDIPF